MKVFIAGPLMNCKFRNIDFYNRIAEICKNLGWQIFIPHLETEPIDNPADEKLVFKQDFEGLHNSDMLIAEVSNPSHGVGSELMQAYIQKKTIICLVKKGKELSRMVIGNPMVKKIVFYENEEECLKQLKNYLIDQNM